MRRGTGMTLVESMIVLGLAGILLSVAMPGLGHLVDTTRADATMRSLATQIALARSTAVAQGQRVTYCPSTDHLRCSGNWTQGSLMFVDRNGDRRVNQGDRVIRVSGPLPQGETLIWRAFQNRAYLQMEPGGFLRYQSGNFTWCPATGNVAHARQLIVNATGRTRGSEDRDDDGIHEDSGGKPLRCE
jgi:type IV fimbrial biogenesis protein FimT